MRRFKYILYSLMAICLFSITACESEKDLIILSGELPSKVKALYLVGNATPKNPTWDIDNLDLLEQSEEDKFLWVYHGELRPDSRFKLCMRTGTWAQPFIHPVVNEEPIGKDAVTGKKMQAPRLGGDDELWAVLEGGIYTLTFNLRDFSWSSVYEGPVPQE